MSRPERRAERSHQRSEMRPNAYHIAAQRNALRSRILRVQRQQISFVLRTCSIIRIMLTNVATSSYWSSGAEQRSIYQRRPTAAAAATANGVDTAAAAAAQVLQVHQQPQQNAKKSTGIDLFQDPPTVKNIGFDWRHVAYMLYITHYLSISHLRFFGLFPIIDTEKVVCHFFVML
jgi:hypothetical protein